MHPFIEDSARVAVMGMVATAVMDAWLLLLNRLGVPTLDFALIGRWVGHMPHGRWKHAAIARAEPVPAERALGWAVHYAVGIAFAAVLVLVFGPDWTREPRLLPALCVGVGSVVAPWFLMQPAMGAGIAASRTPAPARNRLRSLANHTVFGAGLYLAGVLVAAIAR